MSNRSRSCLPKRSNILGRVCGTSIDVEDVDFAPSSRHLVYMDKVYSRAEATACPLVFSLSSSPTNFQTQLLTSPLKQNDLCEEIFGHLGGVKLPFSLRGKCGCDNIKDHISCHKQPDTTCCSCTCIDSCGNSCEIDENAVFEIVNSYVLVDTFNTRPLCNLNRHQVTVDGLPVDSLSCQGGNYTATINNIIPEITQDLCVERCLPTKAFFLITNVGPWAFDAKFVLEGTVNTNGRICCFRAIFETLSPIDINPQCGVLTSGGSATEPSEMIPPPHWNTGNVNLAIPDISIPCTTNGISPIINFTFSGKMSLLNPEIAVREIGGRLFLVLTSRVVAEPSVDVEVVKKTLFCTTACEGLIPCDGTVAALLADEEEDAEVAEFECTCGPSRNEVEPTQDLDCGNTIVFGTNTSCRSTCRGF